jgi:hypothetical protein
MRFFLYSLSLSPPPRAKEYGMFVFLPQCFTDAAVTSIMHDDDLNNIPIVNYFYLICSGVERYTIWINFTSELVFNVRDRNFGLD